MDDLTPGWAPLAIGTEGEPVIVAGIDLWRQEWLPAAVPPVTVSHPGHPLQRHRMSVYQCHRGTTSVTFAAGELSNGVWGFHVPVPDAPPSS